MEMKSTRREWTGDYSDCFYRYNDGEEEQNAMEFADFANANPHVSFYWPNHGTAPWHLQCIIEIKGEITELNFWPHKSKGQFKYEKAIEPLSKFIDEFNSRLQPDNEDDFDVIE